MIGIIPTNSKEKLFTSKNLGIINMFMGNNKELEIFFLIEEKYLVAKYI